MASGYIDWGDDDVKSAMQLGLLHAKRMKEQGKNFFGKDLKIDPKDQPGLKSQQTVTSAKTRIPSAMGRGSQLVRNKRLAQETLKADLGNTVKAAREVGAMEALSTVNPGSKGMGLTTGLFAGKDVTIKGLDAASKAQNVQNVQNVQNLQNLQNAQNTMTITNASNLAGGASNLAGTAATGSLATAASAAMPYLLAAQVVLGLLGSKDDEEAWAGIRSSGNPWGAAGSGGTGVVG